MQSHVQGKASFRRCENEVQDVDFQVISAVVFSTVEVTTQILGHVTPIDHPEVSFESVHESATGLPYIL